MKRTPLTIALAAALLTSATPVLAQSQLERSLGVEAGRYTTHELARIKGVEGQDNGERHVYFGDRTDTRASTSTTINSRAIQIVDAITAAGDEGARDRYSSLAYGGVTFQRDAGAVNARAKRIIEGLSPRRDGPNS